MNLERVDAERSAELELPVRSILLNQMEYIIEVLMKFEPSLQLKVRTTPGNQEFFATKNVTFQSTDEAAQEYLQSHQALMQDEIIEADKVKKENLKLQYTSDQSPIKVPAIVGCLNWMIFGIAHQTRHRMGNKSSSESDYT